ncbi:MAG: hypothetical protein Q7J25_11700 [Vicinamibacterales bacterium]|nr:hypothetical protein [Vicinamibacterales bacterium]
MAGIPLPVDDLPNGSVSVRVIRGAPTNNIPNQAVELHAGSDVLTRKTDAEGRAQFDKLTPGANLKAVAVVDGERLESQEFPSPAKGGIRLLLVATGDKGSAAASSPGPPAVAVAGQVVIGGQSRFILQPGEESVEVYYILEILNNSAVPVNPPTPFAFDMPSGATGTGILEGSSPLASVNGLRVTVNGPFPSGSTLVQVGTAFTVTSGSFDLVQRFPAALTKYAVLVKKVGDTKMSSSQLAGQEAIPAQGETFLGADGTPVAEGQPLTVSLTDMPHHNPAPRRMALSLALGIVLVGVWAATRNHNDPGARTNERKRLIGRREKLLADLVRLERDRHSDRRDNRDDRYRARRAEIVAALEQVYGALDSDGVTPEPGNSAGVAA